MKHRYRVGLWILGAQVLLGSFLAGNFTAWQIGVGVLLGQFGMHLRGRAISNQPFPGFARGPYRQIRHPQYAGEILAILGLCVIFNAWVVWALALVGLVGFYPYQIMLEDLDMLATYRDLYGLYCAKTKRLVPGVI